MNRLDLIIECMEQILNDELPSPENMMKAFRYACELRELKPVAWAAPSIYGGFEGLSFYESSLFDTPLYVLEVTK